MINLVKKIIKRKLVSNNLSLDLLAGFLSGIQAAIYSVTFASIIFSGVLHRYQYAGIVIFLVGTAIIAFIVGMLSSSRIITACPQDTSPILGIVISSSIITSMHQQSPGSDPFPTVITALAIMTLTTGITAVLIGYFKWGRLVHFIPYPVIGGFLVGTGWLIFKAAFFAVHQELSIINLPKLIQPNSMIYWLPGLLYASLIIFIIRYRKHYLIYPALIFSGFIVFYIVVYISGSSLAEAKANGFMLGPFTNQQSISFSNINLIQNINWDLILLQTNNFLIAALLNISGLLLKLVSFELTTKKSIKINQELISAGIANLCVAPLGCIAGFHSLSYSLLNYRLGATGRLTSATVSFVCLSIIFLGISMLSYIPRFVFCVLLFTMSLNYLVEWLIDAKKNLSLSDYCIVIAILLMIANVGLFAGIGFGVLISLVVFVIQYSTLPTIKNSFRGDLIQSNSMRGVNDLEILRKQGDKILILILQDYLFFGNSDALVENIQSNSKQRSLDFIIIDFRLLRGFDSSASITLIKIIQIANKNKIRVLFAQTKPAFLKAIEATFDRYEISKDYRLFPSLDHSLEWCENRLLKRYRNAVTNKPITELIQHLLPGNSHTKTFMQYLIKDFVPKGTIIYKQGEKSDELFFIESGKVEIYRDFPDNITRNRFSILLPGSVVGEIGLYRKDLRSANVSAKKDCVIYRLNEKAFIKLQKEHPTLASSFHQGIVRLLTERVLHGNLIIQQLLQ